MAIRSYGTFHVALACVAGGIASAREIKFWRRSREENGESRAPTIPPATQLRIYSYETTTSHAALNNNKIQISSSVYLTSITLGKILFSYGGRACLKKKVFLFQYKCCIETRFSRCLSQEFAWLHLSEYVDITY